MLALLVSSWGGFRFDYTVRRNRVLNVLVFPVRNRYGGKVVGTRLPRSRNYRNGGKKTGGGKTPKTFRGVKTRGGKNGFKGVRKPRKNFKKPGGGGVKKRGVFKNGKGFKKPLKKPFFFFF